MVRIYRVDQDHPRSNADRVTRWGFGLGHARGEGRGTRAGCVAPSIRAAGNPALAGCLAEHERPQESAAMRRLLILAVGAAALGGLTSCGGQPEHSAVGVISTVEPALCIARHDALGECFTTDASFRDSPVTQLATCVRFTYTSATDTSPAHLHSLMVQSPVGHEEDCPPGYIAPTPSSR